MLSELLIMSDMQTTELPHETAIAQVRDAAERLARPLTRKTQDPVMQSVAQSFLEHVHNWRPGGEPTNPRADTEAQS